MSVGGPSPGRVPPRPGRDWRFWAVLGLLGMLLGLYLIFPRLDADQGVTGLMGVYILRGDFPLFFWSQDHAGVPESYIAAPLFYLFGISRRALDLVPALCTLALALAVYRTGAVLFGQGAGLLGILFMTGVSAYVGANYTLARSYYIAHLLVGQIVLLGAALWLARPLSEPARCRVAIAMGLAGGLGLYFNFQIIDTLVPAALALLLIEPRLPLRRAAWLGLGAFVLGSLPFWAHNLTHNWATFTTGARFQGRFTGSESARILFFDLIPVLLGVRTGGDQPPRLPGPLAWTIPLIVGGAVLLLLANVLARCWRLRRDPVRAGEALILTAIALTIGIVWYGGYVRVARYLLPLVPLLALVLARAAQITWRRTRVGTIAWVTVYMAAVSMDLLPDITALRPEARDQYRQEREADAQLFAFLRANDFRWGYSFDYWLAPRLTFDARAELIIAEPFNDRYPPHTRAVDQSSRPVYVVQAGVDNMRNWLAALRVESREDIVAGYHVFHDFTAPPYVVPITRSGWGVRTSPGRGHGENLIDARLDTGWSSAPGPEGSAWVEVNLGAERQVSGLTLLNDRADRIPDHLVVTTDRSGPQPIAELIAQGVTPRWENGAPRITPSRTLTLRFGPVTAHRLRLVEQGPGGRWSVAELFLLGPAPPGALADRTAATLVSEGQQLENTGHSGAALLRFREAMRRAPDDPAGYEAFARLTTMLRESSSSPLEHARRLADIGLVAEARAVYTEVAHALGSKRVHAELWKTRSRLAALDGDPHEAAHLAREAEAVFAPARYIGADVGGVAELLGYDLSPQPLRTGHTVEITSHWRLYGSASPNLMAWVQFRAGDGPPNGVTRFGEDYPLPAFLPGLGPASQHGSVLLRIRVPVDAQPGEYRLVAGVWNPVSGWHLHRWWRGLVPTRQTTIPLGRVQILRAEP